MCTTSAVGSIFGASGLRHKPLGVDMKQLLSKSKLLLKNQLPAAVKALRKTHPDLEVWTLDEHRVGLKAILRYVWAKRGQRPTAWVHPRYRWRWVYGFVRPETGETDFWISEYADSFTLEAILPAFAARRNGPVLLVMDRAGWHLSSRIREAMESLSITPMWLPAYSPELQPAERLWPLVDAPLTNRTFDSIEALEGVLSKQCVRLSRQQERIQSLTLYHWWPGGTDRASEP